MVGMITVGIGGLSALFSPLEACGLLATKAVWMVDTRIKRMTLEWR